MRSSPRVSPSDSRQVSSPDAREIERWALAYIRHAPISLALREINRLVAIETLDPAPGPTLDVGCGDGFWWSLRRGDHSDVYGIDIAAREVAQAAKLIHADVVDVSTQRPFPEQRFGEIIGNCSLEHVPDIDAALRRLGQAAAPNARLVMFVPTPRWAYQGKIQSLLLRRAPRLAMSLSGALNGFFQHWHLYDHKVWSGLLRQHGWIVEDVRGLGSARSELLFRLFLPPAAVSFVLKQLTGFYPARLAARIPDRLLAPLARLVTWAVSNPIVEADSRYAYEYMIVATPAQVPAA